MRRARRRPSSPPRPRGPGCRRGRRGRPSGCGVLESGRITARSSIRGAADAARAACPVTVGRSRWSMSPLPARVARIAGTPPARCTSSMCQGPRGRDLAHVGHPVGHLVDVRQGVVDARLAGDGQQVEDRVGGAAHGHVQHEGVVEGLARDDLPRRHVLADEVHDARGGAPGQRLPLGRARQGRAVVGQRDAQGLAAGSSSSWR